MTVLKIGKLAYDAVNIVGRQKMESIYTNYVQIKYCLHCYTSFDVFFLPIDGCAMLDLYNI
jgi:hypothetical protein